MKKYIFGGIVLVVAGLLLGISLGSHSGQTTTVVQAPVVGTVNDNSGYNFSGPICHDVVCEDWEGGKIAAKTNQAYWKNTTGATMYVDRLDVSTTGNASSTFNIYAVSTSSPLVPLYDFTAPAATGTNLINNFSFATSSTATTTSSLDKSFAGSVVAVPDGSYVDIYLRSTDGAGCTPQTAKCETATSTNRGFDLFWRLHYHN